MIEPLLLIPGMMCDARLYSPQITAFSASRPVQVTSVARGKTIREMAQAALDGAPAQFALAGLSMGGIVAMEVLRIAPERVTRIALMDTNSQAEISTVAAAREPEIVRAKAGRLNEVLDDMLPVGCFAPNPDRAEVRARVHTMGMRFGADVFIRQSRALQRRPDQQKTLRKIRVPALVLCGAHDTLTPPRRHEFMSELIPYAQLRIIENAGHIPTLEAPRETNAALAEWFRQPMVLR
jgi:pimeloyl-ACP methyl ester carboxylesterase